MNGVAGSKIFRTSSSRKYGNLPSTGEEELKLKRRRDLSKGKYSGLKKKVNSSTEALAQIDKISKSLNSAEVTEPAPTGQSQEKTHGPTVKADAETANFVPKEAPPDMGLVATGERVAQTDESLAPTGDGLIPFGEGSTELSSTSGAPGDGGLTQSDNAIPPAESSATAADGAAGEGASSIPAADESAVRIDEHKDDLAHTGEEGRDFSKTEVLPFIGGGGLGLLDQDNFPLPQVENEGEGLGSMEMSDQLGINNQGLMPMDQDGNMSKALPFSDTPFADLGNHD